MKELVERLRRKAGQYDEYDWHSVTELEAADALERLTAELAEEKKTSAALVELLKNMTAERDALRAALQLIKANTNTLDWPDDINAAIQGAGK